MTFQATIIEFSHVTDTNMIHKLFGKELVGRDGKMVFNGDLPTVGSIASALAVDYPEYLTAVDAIRGAFLSNKNAPRIRHLPMDVAWERSDTVLTVSDHFTLLVLLDDGHGIEEMHVENITVDGTCVTHSLTRYTVNEGGFVESCTVDAGTFLRNKVKWVTGNKGYY